MEPATEGVNSIFQLYGEYGILGLVLLLLIWKGKTIYNWFVDTIKASERLRIIEEQYKEVKEKLDLFQVKVDEQEKEIYELRQNNAILKEKMSVYMHQSRGRQRDGGEGSYTE